MDEQSYALMVSRAPMSMVLTDPRLPDNPIIYVNRAFEELTLYSRERALGVNCRFLQSDSTDPDDVKTLRDAIAEERGVTVDLMNERADGTTFRNRLAIAPIRGDDGEVEAFLGVQIAMAEGSKTPARHDGATADSMLNELQHRVKNHLAMIVSLIRLQARQEITREAFNSLSHRVESLALLYEELSASGVARAGSEQIACGAYLSRIASLMGTLDGRASIRITVECEEIDMNVDDAARLGLIMTELLTNALQHAFRDREKGVIRVRFQRQSGGGARLMVEDDGVGMPSNSTWPASSASLAETGDEIADPETEAPRLGGTIVQSLAKSLNATIDVSSQTNGTVAVVDVPSPTATDTPAPAQEGG